MFDFAQSVFNEMNSLALMMLVVKAMVNIAFASAVARDAGKLAKRQHPTWLTSGVTWAFATLVGGVWVVAIYWLVHYSSLAKVR